MVWCGGSDGCCLGVVVIWKWWCDSGGEELRDLCSEDNRKQ